MEMASMAKMMENRIQKAVKLSKRKEKTSVPKENNKRVKKNVPSISQLEKDPIYQLAEKYWSKPSTHTFDPKIVKQIYKDELSSKNYISRTPILELSRYLENFLWPNYDEKSSKQHIFSIIFMINQKHTETLNAWGWKIIQKVFLSNISVYFHVKKGFYKSEQREKFEQFLKKILNLKWVKKNADTFLEKTAFTFFLTNSYSSFEESLVSSQLFRLCGLPIWLCLDQNVVQHALSSPGVPEKLLKQYKQVQKNEKNFSENEKHFLFSLVKDFLSTVSSHKPEGKEDPAVIYFERFLEFLTDMLSQIPTRRYFKFLVENMHVEEICRISPVSQMKDEGFFFQRLLQMFRFYLRFEIDDLTGEPFTETQMRANHASKVAHMQRVAFKHFPEKLRSLALSNVSSFDNRDLLKKHVQQLQYSEMLDLCRRVGVVGSSEQVPESLLFEVFVSHYERRSSQLDAINSMPLYPTEQMLYDVRVIPDPYEYTGERPLALPKLNLQFLSYYDYLLRNFNLYRLEAAYQIREDLERTLLRLKPKKIVTVHSKEPLVRFYGWSSEALPLKEFQVLYVSPPKLGQEKPASVVATVKFSLKNFSGKLREEWEELKVHDVLFLLNVTEPSSDPSLNFGQQQGLVYVRGCEVLEYKDQEDNLIDLENSNFRPKGHFRTLKVRLDSAQYFLDKRSQLDPSPYTSFNLILKRKRKENNFKAVLHAVRSLINTQKLPIPAWLSDVYLGYGDPKNLSTAHPSEFVDYNDTFLSLEHLSSCFPEYKIEEDECSQKVEKEPSFHLKLDKENKKILFKRFPPKKLSSSSLPKRNSIPFTPKQSQAIHSAIGDGLTLIVGPPGTGKTVRS